MKWVFVLFAVLLLGGTAVSEAHAIIIRHDVEDEQYVQEEGAYAAVFDIFEQRGGVATLIAPQWALTVAHVAQDIPANHPVTIGEELYSVQQTILHPTWNSDDFVDMALLQLDRPVANAEPIGIYEQDDERGQIITLVGRGDTGTGLTGPITADHQLRAATNRVERAESKNLVFRFDAPTDENVTPLEGISGPGDSGGPALLEKNNSLYVVGVSVAQDSAGHARGTYGVWEFYTRVSPQADWIQATIATTSTSSQMTNGEPPSGPETSEVSRTSEVSDKTLSYSALFIIIGMALLVLLARGYLWFRRKAG